ncbi:MAG: ScnB-like protein, partial [Dehalococcoidia bacterium]
WERRADALSQLLNRKGLRRTDESRRAIESMDPEAYQNARYYERWVFALETLLIEKGIVTKDEIDGKMETLDRERGT